MDRATEHQIRAMVNEVIDERVAERDEEVRKIVRHTVAETLVRLGLDAGDPFEVQRDMQHVRRWREATERMQSRGMIAVMAIAISGAAGLLWVGLQQALGRG